MRILFFENHNSQRKRITAKILAYLVAVCIAFSGISFVNADAFDDQAAENGKNFTPVPENEKTSFLLFFGSDKVKGAEGMQGRWKMLTKDQMMSISDNDSALAIFDAIPDGKERLTLWKTGQSFSTTEDGKTLLFDRGISGIDIKNLTYNYNIPNGGINNKTRLTAVDQAGNSESTKDHALENPTFYFSNIDSERGSRVTPLLKIQDGVFSLRTGQDNAKEITAGQWKNDIKTLQIDSVTTATQQPDLVFNVLDGKSEVEYRLGDVVYSGQYDAVFAYRNAADEQITADVRGAVLSDVLAAKSIKLASGDKLYALDANDKEVRLESPVSEYFLAYEGTEKKQDSAETALTSNSEFVLFGPGTTEDQVKFNDVYTIRIDRAPVPPTPVKKPPVTKITKLTKASKTAIKIRWAKKTDIKGYQISMATKKNGKYTTIKTVKKAGTTTFTKKKLKKGKKYFFKVRTYKIVNGKTYYSKWSAAKYKKL